MKKSTIIALVSILGVIIIFLSIGFIKKSMIVGEWKHTNGGDSMIFYASGTGKQYKTGFTWKIKGNTVYVYTEDSRKSHTIRADGKNYTFSTGSAAHTDTYKLNTRSNPYRLEAIDGTTDYVKAK